MHVGNLRMQENVFIIYDLIMLITLACPERVTVVTNVIIVAWVLPGLQETSSYFSS